MIESGSWFCVEVVPSCVLAICSPSAIKTGFAAAWWTSQVVQFLYQEFVRIVWKMPSEIDGGIIKARISCTPSNSFGRVSVLRGGFEENQTALAKLQ